MAGTPEVLQSEPKISEIPTTPEIPPEVERATGVKVVQKQFTAQVKGDKGQPLIQAPPAQVITVSPPAGQTVLTSWSKGKSSDAVTWLGAFWLRVIKKALHFGWRIMGKENDSR